MSKNQNSKKELRIEDLPRDLRGLPNNRFGGHRSSRIRGFRGSTYGAASTGRRYTRAELEEFAAKQGLKVSAEVKHRDA